MEVVNNQWTRFPRAQLRSDAGPALRGRVAARSASEAAPRNWLPAIRFHPVSRAAEPRAERLPLQREKSRVSLNRKTRTARRLISFCVAGLRGGGSQLGRGVNVGGRNRDRYRDRYRTTPDSIAMAMAIARRRGRAASKRMGGRRGGKKNGGLYGRTLETPPWDHSKT